VSHNDPTDVSAYTAEYSFPTIVRGGRLVPDNLARCQCCGTVGCCEVEAAFEAGHDAGARGRGSRARYRRAVARRVSAWTGTANHLEWTLDKPMYGGNSRYHDALRVLHEVPTRSRLEWLTRAAARARRILAALDQETT
jgi:hypothetical protein